ncbi:amidohydrolase [Kineococcus sp. GCM10028916]|uniref:amidohydrolase n=1 Tax=Kineococcus sp. GCM10028916 TaxID=3273394 RepID=UPI00363B1CCE
MTPAPDLIFSGGTVLTMDGDRTASVLAVADGKVQAVGGEELLATRGPRTEVVDLAGGAVLPGFQDAHVHAIAGGLQQLDCDLSGVHGAQEYRRAIAAFAAHHQGPWVEGSGWYGDVFAGGFPTREFLDDLVPERPAAFASHDCHSLWVNSRALDLAGLDEHTPDPADGRIVRDGAGRPTGLLLEGAVDLVHRVRPLPDAQRLRQALRRAQSTLHAAGVTAWQDAIIGEALGLPDNYETYRAAAAEGWLRSRVTGALWWPRGGAGDDVARLIARRAAAVGRFTATAVKIVQDGVCENLTAAVKRPYVGRPEETGLSFFDPQVLAENVRDLVAAGFDLHLHAVGDRAVAECLDAIELSVDPTLHGRDIRESRDVREVRHQIAHIDLIDPADVHRMARLGVIANVQPLWARQDPVLVETKLPYLDEGHQHHHFVFGALHRAGVTLAMGSDWPVSDPTPLWGIHTAVNRTAPPADPHALDQRSQHDPLLPEERLPVLTALQGYTRCASRANRLDHVSGTLTPGLDADLVVLDRNPLDVPATELGSLRVRATAIAGAFVHEAWDRTPTPTA